MKVCIVAVAALIIMGCNQDRLVKARNPECGARCYTGDFMKAGVGICSFGRIDCGDDPTEINPVCVGSVMPQSQQCNGLDNDCDGTVDAPVTVCSTQCGFGLQTCGGPCTAKVPTNEVCNGKDDDCDGIADNPNSLPVEFCYSGPAGTVGIGECRPGVVKCVGGMPLCYGDVLPKIEKCDGLDNDCDSHVDEELDAGTAPMYDFVFILDTSGSMCGIIQKLQYVSSGWAAKYNSSNYQFALVGAPDRDIYKGTAVTVYSNMTSAQQFGAAMSAQDCTGSGAEPTLDAVWQVLNPNNPLSISWRPGAIRGVILFTDEPPQSYMQPSVNEAQVNSMIQLANIDIVAFVDLNSQPSWNPAISGPRARVRDIYMSTVDMDVELDKFITTNTCK